MLSSLLLLFFSLQTPAARAEEPRRQVLGFYANGALFHASVLPPEGGGFVHLFEPRNRRYGSEGLLNLLTEAAAQIAQRFPGGERLQIGDISARHGGSISGHASHQNGLDADLVFYRTDHREQTEADGNRGFVEKFVVSNQLSPNLDLERTWELIKRFESSGRLEMIFMHAKIKQALCARAREKNELEAHSDALRRIHVLNSHVDHMHLRISCPANSPGCQGQGPPGPLTGCQ